MGGKESKLREGVGSVHQQGSKSSNKKGVDLATIPARVDKVNITGVKRTHDDYFRYLPEELFKAKNFHEIIVECTNAKTYLNQLGVFKDCSIYIDISKGENATSNGYEINFNGNELSPIVGEVGTEIGYNEGALRLALAAPNLKGRGERITLRGSYTTNSTSDINLTLLKPLHHTVLRHYHPEFSFSLFRHRSLMPYMVSKTRNFGLLGEFSFSTPFNFTHSLQYEASCRELFCAGKQAPFFVRQSCGPRLMSAIRLSTAYDLRDNPIFPTHGIYLKTTNEYCGLGGDISYLSNTTHAELNIPLYFNWVAQLCTKIGIIHSEKLSKSPPLSSLYILGGPMNLRGFELAGVGPHDDGYATGINSFWAVGLHLWMPLPYHTQLGQFSEKWRTHLFCNFGNCDSFSTNNMRLATGIGLAYRFGQRARIELNWCFPINMQKGDKIKSGFQFGIGYDFL